MGPPTAWSPRTRRRPGWTALLPLKLEATDATAQALVLLARSTGDRVRDLPAAQQDAVAAWLQRLPHAERWLELLRDPASSLRREEQEWIFGESLPSGLVLTSAAESD